MTEIQKQYKKETGEQPYESWGGGYTKEYVEWLEAKINIS